MKVRSAVDYTCRKCIEMSSQKCLSVLKILNQYFKIQSTNHFCVFSPSRVDYQYGILNVGTLSDEMIPHLSPNNLVYLEASPDYCVINTTNGVQGTLGRECSRARGQHLTKAEKRSCKTLCKQCGLQVKKTMAHVTENCNCKFKWCCEVKCETCRKKVNKLTCV